MRHSLPELAAKAETSEEFAARLRRFLGEGMPAPAAIKWARETMGYSQSEFATLLGFSEANGDRTVHAFEIGFRDGKAFAPTPTVLRLIRLLFVVNLADVGPATRAWLDMPIPQNLRRA